MNEIWLKCELCGNEYNKLFNYDGKRICFDCYENIKDKDAYKRELEFKARNPGRKKRESKKIDKYGKEIPDDDFGSIWETED